MSNNRGIVKKTTIYPLNGITAVIWNVYEK